MYLRCKCSISHLILLTDVTPTYTGWEKGQIQYGTGLMIQALSPHAKMPPSLSEPGTYVGHGGDSYGFLSENVPAGIRIHTP